MSQEESPEELQMEFSKSRMAVLRVIYFLIALGVLAVAKVEFELSNDVFLILVLAALAVVVISYPIQMKLIYSVAYSERRLGAQAMIGLEGVAIKDISPVGRVRVRGEIWRAKALSEPISKGEEILVTGIEDGLTLSVERMDRTGSLPDA